MGDYRDLTAYKKAYELAMKIYHTSKDFPREERYSLTDQIWRSSRSVCANLAEAYQRRIYQQCFISKTNVAQAENTETQVWLDFAKDCSYLPETDYQILPNLNTEIGKLIHYMINNPGKFAPRQNQG